MTAEEVKIGPALTWDELADMYPGKARIKPMEQVFDYFARQTDKFYVHPKEGTLHKIINGGEEQ